MGNFDVYSNEWYLNGVKSKDENTDKNKVKVHFNRIRVNKLDWVIVLCEYNPSKNKKVISTFKIKFIF